MFQDSEHKIGSATLELGRLDTLVLTLSKNQAVKDLQQIPDNRGSTLYRLLTDPDNVNLEYLSADLFAVSTWGFYLGRILPVCSYKYTHM